MPPRVTVIIPTYNWSTVLPYSIGSVLDQTYGDFELLVVGDGCTDDSAEVVAGIGDPRVRWINIARSGHQSGPNNEGLRQGRGELVAYLGHDDLWFPHHLACALAAVEGGADVTHSVVMKIHLTGRTSVSRMPPSGVVHRREAARAVGGWPDYRRLSRPPEVVLWERMRAAGLTFAFVPRATVLKFAASERRDVYRERPCHEQRAWLERIRREPDLETTELARLVVDLSRPPADGLLRRVARPLNPRYWLWRRRRRHGAWIRHAQRYKGVD